MVLPSGQISMSQVSAELGYSNSTISLQDTDVRRLAAQASPFSPFLTSSSIISMNDLRGKAAYINATGGGSFSTANHKIHVFTGPGTFTVNWTFASKQTIEYLVVAGGGGGGGSTSPGGGGGAGGLRTGYLPVLPGNYTITVGGGGVGSTDSGPPSTPGSDSRIESLLYFIQIVSSGGGAGRANGPGDPGGSGGGGGGPSGAGGAGNAGGTGQGNDGGFAGPGANANCGGGGGAGAGGQPGPSGSNGGAGD